MWFVCACVDVTVFAECLRRRQEQQHAGQLHLPLMVAAVTLSWSPETHQPSGGSGAVVVDDWAVVGGAGKGEERRGAGSGLMKTGPVV